MMKDHVRYAVGLDSTVDKLVEAKTARLTEALRALVDRLDEINADPVYQSVWVVNQIHAGPYCGPTYVEALDRARAALRTLDGSGASDSQPTPED
jgi:hypothetical protein